MDGTPELAARVAALDADDVFAADDDIERFIEVLEQVTDPGAPPTADARPTADAADADAIVANCRLLARLRAAAPEIVTGPLAVDAQEWVATGKPDHLPAGHPTPDPDRFVAADFADIPPSAKPFDVGVFTSTRVAGGHGMWRRFLEINRGSSLFPLPWRTWSAQASPDTAAREITSAADWVEFIRRYPRHDGALVCPDWRAVAADYDAVHMTLPAIVATQGLYLPVDGALAAAPFWDIESTLWLRWRFTTTRLVETVS